MTQADYLRFEGYVAEWCEDRAIRVELARAQNIFGHTLGVIITDYYAYEPGNGVGAETMGFLIEIAEAMSVSLHLTPEGPRAKTFFLRQGFAEHHRFNQCLAWLPPVPADCEFQTQSHLSPAQAHSN